jgi:hypothetical protein
MKWLRLTTGTQREIFALAKTDKPIFEEELFLELSEDTINKIFSYIDFLSNASLPIFATNISKKLKGCDVWELRPKNVRLLYFLGDKELI